MIALILPDAEADLEQAFDHYESSRPGLGREMLNEFRASIDRILEHPLAWQSMDAIYRRCRLHRFPYGIIYRVDTANAHIVVVAFMHLSRRPGSWRNRNP